MEGYLFRFAPQKEKASQPSLSRYRYFIKKAEKALLQSAFSKNPVISFSVLRAKKSIPHGVLFLYANYIRPRGMSPRANNSKGEAVVNDSPADCQSRRADRSIFSAEKMQDRAVQFRITANNGKPLN